MQDNWDDMFRFSTLFRLVYVDSSGVLSDIGGVKIGQFSMAEDQRSPAIPQTFEQLGDQFFSVGQDTTYYERIRSLGIEAAEDILQSLHDLAFDLPLLERALNESVTRVSLLRNMPATTVRGQFRRIALGGASLTAYSFSYIPSTPGHHPPVVSFNVTPESLPPTNIHVLIGRNGVGKTHLLNQLARTVIGGAEQDEVGAVEPDPFPFASLVSVSFSAFDRFAPIGNGTSDISKLQYSYVGLRKAGPVNTPKDTAQLLEEFSLSLRTCGVGARKERWQRAIRLLDSDPIFKAAGIAEMINRDAVAATVDPARLFDRLSSGHKIVLLTITRLVELVEEQSLVLIDEPEAHLHPPLLSAFVRGHDQPAFAEWILRERDNRDCPTSFHQGGRNIATDPPFMVPYSLVGEEHDDGRAIAGPLWFLRTRMDDLGQQFFGGAATFRGRADRIAWGTIQRLGYNILHLDEVLSKALDTDKDAFDKLFHYEILAAFARHGIKTDSQIAVIQPSTFVVDGRTVTATGDYLPLEARAYLGTGTGYIAEFTTNPATFTSAGHTNEFQQPDPALPGFNFIRMTSSGGGPPVQPARYLADAGGCAFAADATDGKNNFVDLSLSHDQLESLLTAASEQVAPIYMRIASLGEDEAVDSRISDAGGLIAGSNEVEILYISETVPPGCQCSAPGGAHFGGGTVISILGAVLLVVRRRHAS